VALRIIEAHADHLCLVLLERVHLVAEAAGFLGAARRIVLGIKIQHHDFLADGVFQFPGLAVLVFAGDQRRFVTDLGGGCGLGMSQRDGGQQSQRNNANLW
jgi:hypothetical protein